MRISDWSSDVCSSDLLSGNDAILIFSVGGGDAERNISVNLIRAIDMAKRCGAKVFGIVGRATGYTARMGDIVVVIPAPNPEHITPLSEAFQAVDRKSTRLNSSH